MGAASKLICYHKQYGDYNKHRQEDPKQLNKSMIASKNHL